MSREVELIPQIESDVAKLLDRGESASIDKATIENGYTIRDSSEGEIADALHGKCAAIVAALREKYGIEAGYTVMNGTIVFAPVDSPGASSHNGFSVPSNSPL